VKKLVPDDVIKNSLDSFSRKFTEEKSIDIDDDGFDDIPF